MHTIEEMKERKRMLGYSYETLAQKAGLPVGTVQKVLGGFVKAPREKTLLALVQALWEKENGEDLSSEAKTPLDQNSGQNSVYEEHLYTYTKSSVRETAVYQAKRQGEFTVADYEALPDEQRVELIDGVFYDMSSPQADHQVIAGIIYAQLLQFIRSNGGDCMPFIAPMDVQLDCDDRTIMEPDVFVVCDRSKVKRKRIYGAPDFVIEVLSPSTRRKDITIKINKYSNAGVREYWMIDPRRESILVYDFANEDTVQMYHFDDAVPVGIYGGACEITFEFIRKSLEFISADDE